MTDAGGMNRLKTAAPAGAAALAIVVAIAGGSLLANQPTAPVPLPTSAASQAPATPTTANSTQTTSASTASPQVAAPQPGGAIPGVAFDQVPGVSAPQLGMEIVVKFKDDAKIKDIVDSFWKDQGSARTKFDAFKARRPEFANLKLDRVTYSNELVLVHDGGAPPAQRLAAMRTVAAKLKTVGDISYAEPNMTAQPGGQ